MVPTMGGYELYVWSAYLLTVAALASEVWWLWLRQRRDAAGGRSGDRSRP